MKSNVTKKAGANIGILSGLGPLAGSDVLAKLLRYAAMEYGAMDDEDYPDVALISHGITGFDAQGTISEHVENELVALMQKIESNNPSVIGIACNTVHLRLELLRNSVNTPVVNLPEETAKYAASFPDQTYLLLSSYVTRKMGLYHKPLDALGVKFVSVTDEEQEIVDDVVGLVMAFRLKEASAKLNTLISSYADKVTGVIAGCTELPIALDAAISLPDKLYIDSNSILAKVLVDHCYEVASDVFAKRCEKSHSNSY